MIGSDLIVLTQMLDRAKIPWREELCTWGDKPEGQRDPIIVVERGYAGFVTCFAFDILGRLIDVRAYE